MRELDGLSHDEVAERARGHARPASRQLVKRARTGLVAAADARDADCAEIRDDLLTAHDERAARPSTRSATSAAARRCREFRDGLKATRGRLRALIPPSALGPLAGVLRCSAARPRGGDAAKVAAGACCARARRAAARAALAVAGEQHVVRGTSPGVEAGGKTLIGKPIRPGTKLPAERRDRQRSTVAALGEPARVQRARRVTCPAGHDAPPGSRMPRTQDGKVAHERPAHVPALRRATSTCSARHRPPTARRSTTPPSDLAAPVVISVGTLCKRR